MLSWELSEPIHDSSRGDHERRTLPALRSKTCRLLPGNVWNKRLTRIQRRILRRLKSKRRSIGKNPSLRQNLNSYLKPQAIRKLSPFYGNLPIAKMHGGTERASYIPFLLNPETRSDVIPVRLHFRETLPQARQLISHRKIRVNNEMVNMTRFQVSRGDPIPIVAVSPRDLWAMGRKVRKYFYIEGFVDQIVGKCIYSYHPQGMWRRTKKGWFRLLEKRQGCRLLLKSLFLQRLRSPKQWRRSMQESYKLYSASVLKGVCLGSLFAEHDKMKRNSYYSVFLKRRNGGPTCLSSLIVNNGLLCRDSTYWFESPSRKSPSRKPPSRKSPSGKSPSRKRRIRRNRRIRKIELPTHYLEVNHRTPKAVVSYGPDIGHIPPDMRLKDPNLP
uniref:Ribosomal protein S4 n=1 Tax=Cephalotaxus sinensis TaxID=89484 RepID=A0A8F4RHJ3_9CONI|nr:ribosomal protein S4 [Cephalotaxus sinensis]